MSYGSSPFGGGAANLQSTQTRQQLRDATYAILNDLQTSKLYDKDYLNQLINNQHVKICMKKKWQFLEQKQLFTAPVKTTLSAAITTQSTTITVGDTTNFQDPGAVWIEGDIINYTGKTSTTLTGVTNIDLDHSTTGVNVEPLIAVPSDYWRDPNLYEMRDRLDNQREYTYVYNRDYDNYKTGTDTLTSKFTIYTDNNGDMWMRVYGMTQGNPMMFNYLKQPQVLDEDTSVSDIPDPWAIKTIPPMVAYKAMIYYGDNVDGLGTQIKQEAIEEMKDMEKYFGMRDEGWSKRIMPTYRSYRRRSSNTNYTIL